MRETASYMDATQSWLNREDEEGMPGGVAGRPSLQENAPVATVRKSKRRQQQRGSTTGGQGYVDRDGGAGVPTIVAAQEQYQQGELQEEDEDEKDDEREELHRPSREEQEEKDVRQQHQQRGQHQQQRPPSPPSAPAPQPAPQQQPPRSQPRALEAALGSGFLEEHWPPTAWEQRLFNRFAAMVAEDHSGTSRGVGTAKGDLPADRLRRSALRSFVLLTMSQGLENSGTRPQSASGDEIHIC